jgi:hypothetical protein
MVDRGRSIPLPPVWGKVGMGGGERFEDDANAIPTPVSPLRGKKNMGNGQPKGRGEHGSAHLAFRRIQE